MYKFLITLGLLVALCGTAVPAIATTIPSYPLKASANGRYLVDQNNAPFLIVGDSPQGLMAVSPADQQTYIASRAQAGVNALWVSLLCTTYSDICPSINAYGNVLPFTTPGDLSTPNPNYFALVDSMLNLAAQYNMVVFLGPIETGAWLDVLRSNGTTKDYNYGVYLGNRYKNFPNIVWLSGNDFQTWTTASDDAVVQAVANGIKSVDTNHLQTVELDFPTSASLNDPTWAPIVSLDSAYSYYSTYDQVLREYNRSAYLPVYFIEGVYEYQGYMGGYQGPHELRAQEYWTQLSGSAGQFYGNANLFGFPTGWQTSNWQTSPGITQFTYFKNLFQDRAWYNLIPDQNHSVVTSGYGTYQSITAQIMGNTSNYVTTAMTGDGSLAIAYMPTVRTITVDMSKFASTVQAQWYDPTNGQYSSVAGSPFPNSGSMQFTPAGNNSEGSGDWVLVLETTVTPTPTLVTSTPTVLASDTPTPIPSYTPTSGPSNTPTLSPTMTFTPSPTAVVITMGETRILGMDDSGNGNLLVAYKTSLSQTATIWSLSFYVTGAVGNLRLGVYDNLSGKPNKLKAFTAEFTPVVGWNKQCVTSPVSLPKGTYWLAYLPQSSDLHFRMTQSGSAVWYSYPYGVLPSTFPRSVTTGVYHWSFYGSLAP